jgi:hypothetical protein
MPTLAAILVAEAEPRQLGCNPSYFDKHLRGQFVPIINIHNNEVTIRTEKHIDFTVDASLINIWKLETERQTAIQDLEEARAIIQSLRREANHVR